MFSELISKTIQKHFKTSLVIAGLFVLFAGIAIVMVVPGSPVGFMWDDAWYLLMTEWFSRDSSTRELAWSMLQFRQYPPFFPFLAHVAGASLTEPQPAYLLNALFLSLGTLLALVWFRLEGFNLASLFFAGCIVQLNPIAMYWLPTLFSEHLFIALSTGALVLANSHAASDRRSWVIIGLLAGLAVATRSIGWSLMIGLALHLVFSLRLKTMPFYFCGAVLGLAFIPFLNAGLPEARNYTSSLISSVTTINVEFLADQLASLWRAWINLWGLQLTALIVTVTALPGFLLRLKNNRADAWYLMLYLLVVVIWPYPGHMERFLWPLIPVVIVASSASIFIIAQPKYYEHTILIFTILVFGLALPGTLSSVWNRIISPPQGYAEFSRLPEWLLASDRDIGMQIVNTRAQIVQDLHRVAELTNTSDCIYSEYPALIAAVAMRTGIVSPWQSPDSTEGYPLLCPYYYAVPGAYPEHIEIMYPGEDARFEELFRTEDRSPDGQLLAIFYRVKIH